MTKEFNAGFDELGVGIAHHFGGGVYAKETIIPEGVMLRQHKHSFTHLSILATGEVVVSADGVAQTYKAPACIEIVAGVEHEVLALTDSIWYCIHATDCTDPEQIDHELTDAAH